MAVCGITTKGNEEQGELIRLIMEKNRPIIICTGEAGTGKNYVSIAAALQQVYFDRKFGKIYYGRNPVQCGEKMGFLAGDLEDKYLPFLAPLTDNLERIGKQCGVDSRILKQNIEALPIAFLRGRSFENCIVIIDECQNLDLMTLKTIVTRMGKFTKLILLGCFNQIDDPKQLRYPTCDFEEFTKCLTENFPNEVGHVELVQSMRSPITGALEKTLTELGKKLNRK